MKAYINKSAIVAEIERKMNLCKKILLRSRTRQNDDYHQGNIDAYEVVISLLDTLEVKEVGEEPTSNDLEEAAHSYVDTTIEWFDSEGSPCCYSAFIAGAQWQKKQEVKEVDLEKEVHNAADQYDINNNGNIYWEDIVGFAKHFFELGLKAQKGG